jgi:hypothetical protein
MRKLAVILMLRREPYPHPQFAEGFKRLGYECVDSMPRHIGPEDVLCVWNRSGIRNHAAMAFEAARRPVIVAENGWIGRAPDGGKLYALCLDHHNGAGRWFVGDGDRLSKMKVEIKPWRKQGRHILVIASRGIGEPGIAQPRDWPITIARDLHRVTDRPIKVRLHPGDRNAPMDDDLRGAHAAVTWASGGAIKALASGVPIFYHLEHWIGASAAIHGVGNLEAPFLGDRLPMFHRLSWAQWTSAEIATGEPIAWLLSKSQSTP